jgi:O-antigen ligase
MLGMCACVGLGAASTRLLSFRRERRVGRLGDLAAIQALLYAAAATIIFGLVQTRSRGALLALAAALFVTGVVSSRFISSARLRWSARGALLLFLGAFTSFLWSHPAWLGGLLTSPGNSVAYRVSMDRTGWQIFLDFPIFGIGLGGVITAFAPYKESLIDGVVDHVHNDWLEFLIQTGGVGISLCTLAAGVFARGILRSWFVEPSREARLYSAGAIAAAVFFLIHAFVEFSFQIPANAVLFFSIISLLGSQRIAR